MADSPTNSGGLPVRSAAPTNDDREQVIETLSSHFANDRLSLDEFERRAAAVYAAPDRPVLHALVADLAAALVVSGGTRVAESPDHELPEFDRMRVLLSSTGRSGPFEVPHRLEVRAVCGDVELDLRSATFRRGVTVIDVNAVLSKVVITVRADVPVEVTGTAMVGTFHVSATHATSALPARQLPLLVRVTGRSILARVEVRVVPHDQDPDED